MKRGSYTNKKGLALILVYLLIALLVILLSAFFYMSYQSIREGERRQDRLRAFYAAESAVDLGMSYLPVRYPPMPAIPIRNLGSPTNAQCRAAIAVFPAGATAPYTKWIITGEGFVPDSTTTPRVEKETKLFVELSELPENFYDNALYSAGDLTIKGDAYTVNGDVFYDSDDNLDVKHPGNITGDINSGDPVDFSLGGDLDYQGLRDIAAQQELSDPTYDHLITAADLTSGIYTLPDSFWFGDPANGIPNVVYVEGDLEIGSKEPVGGFIIVAGDILGGSTPDTDGKIKGGATIDGCILVVDDLEVKGGGGKKVININGSLWAGNLVDSEKKKEAKKDGLYVNGDVNVIYNQDYMIAVKDINPSSQMKTVSWGEVKSSGD